MLFIRCVVRNRASLIVSLIYGFLIFYSSRTAFSEDIVTLIFSAFALLLGWMVWLKATAHGTFRMYNRAMNVLRRYGMKSIQFQNVKPHDYCTKVGHKMAVADYQRNAPKKRT